MSCHLHYSANIRRVIFLVFAFPLSFSRASVPKLRRRSTKGLPLRQNRQTFAGRFKSTLSSSRCNALASSHRVNGEKSALWRKKIKKIKFHVSRSRSRPRSPTFRLSTAALLFAPREPYVLYSMSLRRSPVANGRGYKLLFFFFFFPRAMEALFLPMASAFGFFCPRESDPTSFRPDPRL